MKTPDLKKCPFCAGDALLMYNSDLKSFYVACNYCGARTQGYCYSEKDAKRIVNEMLYCMCAAANLWNARRWKSE